MGDAFEEDTGQGQVVVEVASRRDSLAVPVVTRRTKFSQFKVIYNRTEPWLFLFCPVLEPLTSCQSDSPLSLVPIPLCSFHLLGCAHMSN